MFGASTATAADDIPAIEAGVRVLLHSSPSVLWIPSDGASLPAEIRFWLKIMTMAPEASRVLVWQPLGDGWKPVKQ